MNRGKGLVEFVGLLGLLAFVVASLVVGGRVFLLAMRTRQLPETSVSLSLILAGGIGMALRVVPLLLPDMDEYAAYLFVLAGSVSQHLGYAFLYLFVWRVFRPRETWAACLFFVTTGLLVVGGVGTAIGLTPGGVLPGRTGPADLWFWVSLGSRFVVYAWATFESFHYHAMLKRRLALGLADPVLVGRFFYWGVSTSAVFCIWVNLAVQALMLDSPWFASIPDIVSTLLGFVVAGSLSLAFFPRKVRNAAAEAPEEAAS
jgi:hypothetical protein